MEKKQALEIIKQVIDAAIKRGLFESVEVAVQVSDAFCVIKDELMNDDTQPQ